MLPVQVCSQDNGDVKKILLRRTLEETRQLIDDTLGDRNAPFTTFLSRDSITPADAGVAMLEHYSVELADRVCALVNHQLLPGSDDTCNTKL